MSNETCARVLHLFVDQWTLYLNKICPLCLFIVHKKTAPEGAVIIITRLNLLGRLFAPGDTDQPKQAGAEQPYGGRDGNNSGA